MDDFDAERLHHLFPPGVSLIRLQDVLAPDTVPALGEGGDAQGVNIAAQGDVP